MKTKEENQRYNLLVMGVSCFDGMANSTRVMNLLEPLQEANLVCISNLIYGSEKHALSQKSGTLHNINYKIITFNKKNPLSFLLFFQNGLHFLKKNKSNSNKNILYNYQQADIKNLIFLVYARLIGYKVVLDLAEDNDYYTEFPNLLNRFKIKSSVFLLRASPFIAHSILAISKHLYDKLNIICAGKISVFHIPITVDMKHFVPREINKDRGSFKIFYGGSFAEKDGLAYLINSFGIIGEKFGNVELIITGRGSCNDSKKLQTLIGNSRCKDKIIQKGYLDKGEFYQTLNECDIFCMTRVNSRFSNAGFPFKLGQFLASGKAVIATRVGDVPHYLTNDVNSLLIRPESVVDLVDALSYLLSDPEKINLLGENARRTAFENFDSIKISKNLLQIFKSI